MPTSVAGEHHQIVDEIAAQARQRVGEDERDVVEAFARRYYARTDPEDLQERRTEDLCGAALAHWRLAHARARGQPKIRAYNPTVEEHGWECAHTVFEIVTDDMPFLVDSVRMAINRHALTIHLLIHPVMRLKRDAEGRVRAMSQDGTNDTAEAVMHVEVDRHTEREVIDAVAADIRSVLDDVSSAVSDWTAMKVQLKEILRELETSPPPLGHDEVEESRAFLAWLDADHFTFLGYREYELLRKDDEDVLSAVPNSGLGVLRGERSGRVSSSFSRLPPEVRGLAREKRLLILTRGNSRSTVHRPGYIDYVGVKRFDDRGEVSGERRFLGLYTSAAYNRSPTVIPLLRDKVNRVLDRADFAQNSHAGKALLNILETFPRDELFQLSEDELYDTTIGILHLQERQRVRLFVHPDRYGRFYSCLVFVPRERFNTQVRLAIQSVLQPAFMSDGMEFSVELSDSVLAKLHLIFHVPSGSKPEFSVEDLEASVRKVTRTWNDDLQDELLASHGKELGTRLFRSYGQAFRADYRDSYDASVAVEDIDRLEQIRNGRDLAMSLCRRQGTPEERVRFKLFRADQPIPLCDALPVLERMGLRVVDERPSEVKRADDSRAWVHDFGMQHFEGADFELAGVWDLFRDAFTRIWRGEVENDGFNRLVLRARLSWREVVVLRAYCKYLQQAGVTFSQAYMEQTLAKNPAIARKFVELFHRRLEPGRLGARERRSEALIAEIHVLLDAVASLDEDRILRSFLGLIAASLRTNYYQRDAGGEPKPYLSIKFDPKRISELPEPRPMFEIFVYSPRVEGVHLRGGAVARGGLRWSDRREDFRTEVLGLVKAQMVKNAIIVPVGSKGGFYPKQLPSGDREAVLAEGIACYKTFLRGLLDVTDNLVGDTVVPPADVVRHDGDDSYLVVAADKGTATFSDIANALAGEYGFWLGDAFASGGSQGYDHKRMGITARGAWESVKRHFRELGVDVQSTGIRVVGIGDMAGDVFGNGMLLSEHIRLVGAFNHMHIFVDPNPDTAAGFAERQRLFDLPRSTWADYDKNLISKGGGVFSRSEKTVPLSPEMQECLGVGAVRLAPNELIKAMLRSNVDLLWNGGIGTYVKASAQHHDEVGDRANDGVRVDATQLRCKVVGEGGNLGFTQNGRIEFARLGGRIFTDAVDNSAGVDCSDHEVNIKILLDKVVEKGDITEEQRNQLLGEMTDEVAGLVLRNNYLQTQALSLANAQAPSLLDVHSRLMARLERNGGLDRAIEFLPPDEEVQDRLKAGTGLTNPELAVLMAYVKLTSFQDLLSSDLPRDPYLLRELEGYFPTLLRERYRPWIPGHRLAAEIISTVVSNAMVNRCGISFAFRLGEETGAELAEISRAHIVAREIFGMEDTWAEIESLDNRIGTQTQLAMQLECRKLLERASRWLLRKRRAPLDIEATVSYFAAGIGKLADALPSLVASKTRGVMRKQASRLTKAGVPERLSKRMATFNEVYSALDIVELSDEMELGVEEVAAVYFSLGTKLDLDWMRDQIVALPRGSRWQTLARAGLRDDFYEQKATLTREVFRVPSARQGSGTRTASWMQVNAAAVDRCRQILSELREAGRPDFAMLSVALREIRSLRLAGDAGEVAARASSHRAIPAH